MIMTLDAIKHAITQLPGDERASLVSWLSREDAASWDNEIEADFSDGGDGIALLEKWDAEIKAGGAVPLEDFLAEQRAAHKSK